MLKVLFVFKSSNKRNWKNGFRKYYDLVSTEIFLSFFKIPSKKLEGNLLIFSVDNSDYMRNGDFVPTRLQAQQDAVNLVCHSKTRSNPENNVGLLTLARYVICYHCSLIFFINKANS